jgi:hypothetical protein
MILPKQVLKSSLSLYYTTWNSNLYISIFLWHAFIIYNICYLYFSVIKFHFTEFWKPVGESCDDICMFCEISVYKKEHLCNISWFSLQGRIVLAPFFYVNFADFWLADQLNSLVIVFVDFQYFICFYLANDNWMVATGKKLHLSITYISCDVHTHL